MKNLLRLVCVVALVAVAVKLMARFPPEDAPFKITLQKKAIKN
jgi:hypothetical protein